MTPQCFEKQGGFSRDGTHEDRNIAAGKRPIRPEILVKDFAPAFEQFADSFGDEVSLGLKALEFLIVRAGRRFVLFCVTDISILLRRVIRQEQIEFDGAFEAVCLLRVNGSRMKFGLFVILDFRRLFRHNLTENEVDRLEHFGAAAEILIHRNELIRAVTGIGGIGFEFMLEQSRIGETEPVNTLFDVTDDKPVAFTRDETN